MIPYVKRFTQPDAELFRVEEPIFGSYRNNFLRIRMLSYSHSNILKEHFKNVEKGIFKIMVQFLPGCGSGSSNDMNADLDGQTFH